jgi:PAS domain S-box-containing protein
MFDDKMRYLAVSRRFLSDYALGEPAEVIGRSQYEIFPDIPPHRREVHARVLAGEEVTREEDLFPRQDGRIYWVRWSMKPWRTINGGVGGALLFAEVITEQVEAKRALADSETRFRATFENAAVGIAHVAPDGSWLRVNEALCRILGYPVDELVTKTFQDVTHPDDLAIEVGQVELMCDGKIDSYGVDKRYLRKDGAIVWGRKTISCIRKKDGSIDYFVSVIEDISARKRAEELLRRQADLLDQSHDAIFTWKIGGAIAYWSRGAEKLYGYTSEEAIGRISHELLQTRETRAHIAAQDVEAQIAQQGSWYGELTHTTRDGTCGSPTTAISMRLRQTATSPRANVPKMNYVKVKSGSGPQSSTRQCLPSCSTIGNKSLPSAEAGSRQQEAFRQRNSNELRIGQNVPTVSARARY